MEKIWNEMYEAAKAVLNERRISEYVTCGEVSAAVCSKSGRIYTGVCIDTCSTLGICAERNAIFNAITCGVKKGEIVEINVMTSSTNTIGMPCFVCRQMLSELFDKDSKVICYNKAGESVTHTVEELCPYPFGEEDLK